MEIRYRVQGPVSFYVEGSWDENELLISATIHKCIGVTPAFRPENGFQSKLDLYRFRHENLAHTSGSTWGKGQ